MTVWGAAMAPAWPAPFAPSGFEAVGNLHEADLETWQVGSARHGVVHEGRADELTGFEVVERVFHQGLADALGDAAMNLAFGQQRVHQGAVVVDGDIADEPDFARPAVDFDFARRGSRSGRCRDRRRCRRGPPRPRPRPLGRAHVRAQGDRCCAKRSSGARCGTRRPDRTLQRGSSLQQPRGGGCGLCAGGRRAPAQGGAAHVQRARAAMAPAARHDRRVALHEAERLQPAGPAFPPRVARSSSRGPARWTGCRRRARCAPSGASRSHASSLGWPREVSRKQPMPMPAQLAAAQRLARRAGNPEWSAAARARSRLASARRCRW